MKVVTLFGTRPEIIRLSQVIKNLDRFCDQVLVHTGQNYDKSLSDIFFKELDLREPDIHLGVQSTTFSDQIGLILSKTGKTLEEVKPDRLLILGDTNSGLAAIVAARMSIPVYHMEAGNRCYDNRVPEEINRRIIDHSSNVLMPYTHRSKENLLREGIERDRIFVIGNPIYEVLSGCAEKIRDNETLDRFEVSKGKYFLVTAHRSETVDDPHRLSSLGEGLKRLVEEYDLPMIVSLHPHTSDRLIRFGYDWRADRKIRLVEPMGLFDFVALEKNAFCVVSDSGTVQEECCIFNVPNITIRDVTERAETIEAGSNMLTGVNPDDILRAVNVVVKSTHEWVAPPEYLVPNVAATVTKIVLENNVRPCRQ